MDQAAVTRAEKEALNVFHDLQIAHARSEEKAPKRAARLRISAQGNILEDNKDALSRFRTDSRFRTSRPIGKKSR